jgi:hypothetical protein
MDVMILVHFMKAYPYGGRVEITEPSKLYGEYADSAEALAFLREHGWTARWEGNRSSNSVFIKEFWRPLHTRRLVAEIISRPHCSISEFPNLLDRK